MVRHVGVQSSLASATTRPSVIRTWVPSQCRSERPSVKKNSCQEATRTERAKEWVGTFYRTDLRAWSCYCSRSTAAVPTPLVLLLTVDCRQRL